jgi:hypothetical protein
MARPKRPGTTYFGLDVPEEDFKVLKAAAVADDRPLASLIRRIFREWIQSQKEQQKSKAKTKTTGD